MKYALEIIYSYIFSRNSDLTTNVFCLHVRPIETKLYHQSTLIIINHHQSSLFVIIDDNQHSLMMIDN